MGQCFLHGKSGGGLNKSIIIVTDLPTGSTVTATKGEEIKTAIEKNGEWWIKNLDLGKWTLKATLDNQSATTTFNIERVSVYRVSMAYRLTPEFSYTGEYEIVDDDDQPIEDFAGWTGNWKTRFLTSGVLKFTNLHGWGGMVDVFGVGGGGANGKSASGSSLYRAYGAVPSSYYGVKVLQDESYQIDIGAGATSFDVSAGDTTAFFNTWKGRKGETDRVTAPYDAGQLEFDGNTSSEKRYGGNIDYTGSPPSNTGKGSSNGGESEEVYNGASGIVIIRNAREAA